jgi:hypothetical protein
LNDEAQVGIALGERDTDEAEGTADLVAGLVYGSSCNDDIDYAEDCCLRI